MRVSNSQGSVLICSVELTLFYFVEIFKVSCNKQPTWRMCHLGMKKLLFYIGLQTRSVQFVGGAAAEYVMSSAPSLFILLRLLVTSLKRSLVHCEME